jgi:hypothetical protein
VGGGCGRADNGHLMSAEGFRSICIACRSPIDRDASVCPVCKSWQARWKNVAAFYAGFATVVTLIVTAIFYIFSTLSREIKTSANSHVLEFAAPLGNQIYTNAGQSDAFLSHVEIYWGYAGNQSITVAEEIKSGQIISRAYPSNNQWYTNYEQGLYLANDAGDGTIYEDFAAYGDVANCVGVQFFSVENNEIKRMNQHYQKENKRLATIPVTATLYYYINNDERIRTAPFDAVGAFLVINQGQVCPAGVIAKLVGR